MKIFLPTARGADRINSIPNLPSDTIIISPEPLDVPYPNVITQTRGYWRILNEVLTYIPLNERFIWLADDIKPHKNWWELATEAYSKHVPYGLGLLAMNDMNIKDAGCAFGMTTRNWLDIIFGTPYFPIYFGHNFVDTIAADRSKDLMRYYFCEEAIVEHLHPSIGKAEWDEVYEANKKLAGGKDKPMKDKMDKEWERSAMKFATMRLLKKEKKNNG